MTTKEVVIAIDIYGTILNPQTIAKELELYFGECKARKIADLWRQLQVEYTWRLNSMGRFISFVDVTRNALVQSLSETDSHLGSTDITSLMNAHDSMTTFEDVDEGFKQLRSIPNTKVVIFTNGSHSMVSNAVLRSKDFAIHAGSIKDIISVEEIKQYKPAPAVYKLLAERVGKGDTMKDIWLVSGNAFDIAGALSAGMHAIYLDRQSAGWKDRAVPEAVPTAVVGSLSQVADFINSHYKIYGGKQ